MSRNRDEYGAIWGRGPLPGAGEELDGLGLAPTDDLYSDVYDEDGDEVLCAICGSEVKWREEDGVYMCPNCGYPHEKIFRRWAHRHSVCIYGMIPL